MKNLTVANPSGVVDALNDDSVWLFSFGAYGNVHVAVWKEGRYLSSLEDALEAAAEVLAEKYPGFIHSPEEMDELYREAAKDMGVPWPPEEWDADYVENVREAAETDMTYTESGYIPSWEWGVAELSSRDPLFYTIVKASVKQGDFSPEEKEDIRDSVLIPMSLIDTVKN